MIRWLKFNLVGALGMAVQLGTLALLNRVLSGHYLLCTALAIELTLLHNFFWHLRFTWRDRSERGAVLPKLLRFQLSNGLVSLTGNLAIMRLLVRGLHVPLLPANLFAILCCSAVNFTLGHFWAFPEASSRRSAAGAGFALTPSKRRDQPSRLAKFVRSSTSPRIQPFEAAEAIAKLRKPPR